jgi:hypothetical protein
MTDTSKSNIQWIGYSNLSEFSRPQIGKKKKIIEGIIKPEFCISENYIRPRLKEYSIEIPELSLQKNDIITLHFRANRNIVSKIGKNDIQYYFGGNTQKTKDIAKLKNMSISIRLHGENGYSNFVFSSDEIIHDYSSSIFAFSVNVPICKNINLCNIKYSLYWNPFRLNEKSHSCDNNNLELPIDSDWIFNFSIYIYSDEKLEIINSPDLVRNQLTSSTVFTEIFTNINKSSILLTDNSQNIDCDDVDFLLSDNKLPSIQSENSICDDTDFLVSSTQNNINYNKTNNTESSTNSQSIMFLENQQTDLCNYLKSYNIDPNTLSTGINKNYVKVDKFDELAKIFFKDYSSSEKITVDQDWNNISLIKQNKVQILSLINYISCVEIPNFTVLQNML